MPTLKLVQLPVPPPAALAPTGNVPLASGSLAVSAQVHGLDQQGLKVEVISPEVTDLAGDSVLADLIAQDEPAFVGFSLYLWNSERSLHLARQIQARSPRTRVLVGGPEVSADNPYILGEVGFDIAVTGEAEDTFAAVMKRLLAGESPAGLPNVAVRDGQRGPLGPFGPVANANFPLVDYPSPYLTGALPVDATRSSYIETVRGCRSHCTFCFYPRSSNVLRTLDIEASAALVAGLRDRGAREVVFLDPTFNHRPGFPELVEALTRVNSSKSLTFFAEVRAEGLKPVHAVALAKAGFTKLEIGLQSVNRETLKRVKRFGDPNMVAEVARMLKGEGIELLVDLIIGLPGDTPDDVARGVDFLLAHDLADSAQVFALSLLPGTPMRATAEADGVVFDPRPPYRVRQTAGFTPEAIVRCLDDAEEALGRRLDEFARPHLACEGAAPYREFAWLDLDKNPSHVRDFAVPSARHGALWLVGDDLFGHRSAVLAALDRCFEVEPQGTLDVVLRPLTPCPLDLLEVVRAKLARGPQSYLARAYAHRGQDAQRRLVICLPAEHEKTFDSGWIQAAQRLVPVFADQTAAQAARHARRLGDDRPAARITDPEVSPDHWRTLVRDADPEAVAFAWRPLEARWTAEVLRD